MVTRGTLYWEQWKGWQRGEKVLAEPSAASLGVQLHVWVLLVEGLRVSGVSGVGGGVASHSMRVYSRFLSQHLNYYFRKRAICASRFLRIRNTLPLFLLFGMFFGDVVAVAAAVVTVACAAFAFALAFYVFAYECGAVIFVACFEAPHSPMRYVLEITFNAKILNVHSVTVADGHDAWCSSAGMESALAPPLHTKKRKLLFINFVSS